MADRTCIVAGCDRSRKLVRGMCEKHYRYWLDHTPHDQRGPAPRQARYFWDFVEKTSRTGCWTWTGKRNRAGYGLWGKKLAHRVSLAMEQGPIAEGMLALHRCDNPPCVNPKHLYPGSSKDNVRDMLARGRDARSVHGPKTHCSRGHEYAGDNVRVRKTGARVCLTCARTAKRAWEKRWRRERGLQKTRVDAAERLHIHQLRSTGMTQRAIATATGRALVTVQKALKEAVA